MHGILQIKIQLTIFIIQMMVCLWVSNTEDKTLPLYMIIGLVLNLMYLSFMIFNLPE